MLSVSDLIVAISHLWGVSQDFDKLLDIHYPNDTADIQCTTQAVLAVFGTLASFMWTLALVSFVFFTYCMKGIA